MKQLFKNIRRKFIDNSKPLPKYYKIASMLKENKKVLDFGCWNGDLSKILIQEKNAQVTGCDLIEESKFKNKNFKYIKVTKEKNFPFKEKFDYIIFAGVLEHLENPNRILEEAFKHTNRIILSIPNLNFFLYKLFPKLENPPIELTPHLHHWKPKEFINSLPKNYKITKKKFCTDFPEFRWTNKLFPGISFFHQTLVLEVVRK